MCITHMYIPIELASSVQPRVMRGGEKIVECPSLDRSCVVVFVGLECGCSIGFG